MIPWEQLYATLGVTELIAVITSPDLQDMLFPVKAVFILFAAFFFCAVIYFYLESSYLKYQFLQDISEFFFWQPYGLRDINRRWKSIIQKTESDLEADYRLAIMEADDFLHETLETRGYEGESFEELVENARRVIHNDQGILQAHTIRNSLIYDPNYKLDIGNAKRILADYEIAIKNAAVS
jgi:hypothetical protein